MPSDQRVNGLPTDLRFSFGNLYMDVKKKTKIMKNKNVSWRQIDFCACNAQGTWSRHKTNIILFKVTQQTLRLGFIWNFVAPSFI